MPEQRHLGLNPGFKTCGLNQFLCVGGLNLGLNLGATFGVEHLGELVGFVVRYMDDVFGINSFML